MRKNLTVAALILIACLALVFAGCAKKVAVKEEAPMEKQAAVERQSAPAAAPAEAAKAPAEESAAEKEKALAAAKAAKEASEFADIRFAFDRSDLRPDARDILQRHADWLKAHPEYVARIEGNCDERGTVEYNLALGERRAASAMKYLAGLGVDQSRLTTISYGKERPLDPGHNEEAWAKNRRDHFVVTLKK